MYNFSLVSWRKHQTTVDTTKLWSCRGYTQMTRTRPDCERWGATHLDTGSLRCPSCTPLLYIRSSGRRPPCTNEIQGSGLSHPAYTHTCGVDNVIVIRVPPHTPPRRKSSLLLLSPVVIHDLFPVGGTVARQHPFLPHPLLVVIQDPWPLKFWPLIAIPSVRFKAAGMHEHPFRPVGEDPNLKLAIVNSRKVHLFLRFP